MTFSFPNTLGHDSAKERLLKSYQNDRIPSAYLLLGDSGIGKSTLIKEFAQFVNCNAESICQTCENCKLFGMGAHPDFIVIKPDGKFIRIGQIHELAERLSLRPAYAKKRIVLVNDAHRMNLESANSFLKILEEPPLDTLIVLMAPEENLLLETILSRCQKITFSPLDSGSLEKIISEKFDVNRQEMDFILNYSGGRIRKSFIENVNVLYAMRRQVYNMITSVEIETMVSHCHQLDQWIKKDLHEYFLEFCLNWLKDFIYLEDGQADLVTNKDLLADVGNHVSPLKGDRLLAAFDITVETELSIRSNANKILALESLIIQFKQLQSGILII